MKAPLLSVVDDDESVREALPDLLREALAQDAERRVLREHHASLSRREKMRKMQAGSLADLVTMAARLAHRPSR